MKEADRLKGGDLSEDELTRVKEGLIASRPHELEPLAAEALSASLNELYGLGTGHEKEYANMISSAARAFLSFIRLSFPGFFKVYHRIRKKRNGS